MQARSETMSQVDSVKMQSIQIQSLKQFSGASGHERIATHLTEDLAEREMILKELACISKEFQEGKITERKKLELKEAIIVRQ